MANSNVHLYVKSSVRIQIRLSITKDDDHDDHYHLRTFRHFFHLKTGCILFVDIIILALIIHFHLEQLTNKQTNTQMNRIQKLNK